MNNLSDYLHDLIENSLTAGATFVDVQLQINAQGMLRVVIKDNGRGIPQEELTKVTHPFFTSRKERRQGLGLSLIEQASIAAGGSFCLDSSPGQGTSLNFLWNLKHIDCQPIGDIPDVFFTLVRVCKGVDFRFLLSTSSSEIIWDSSEIRETAGDQMNQSPEIKKGIIDFLSYTSTPFRNEWNRKTELNNSIELKILQHE